MLPGAVHEETSVVFAAPRHAILALGALIEELDSPRLRQRSTHALEADIGGSIADARRDALDRLAAADRLDLFDAAAQALAIQCARRELPQPARAAAYSALLGLIASDLLPHATFRTLYQPWEDAIDSLGDSSVILRGEEVLLHID